MPESLFQYTEREADDGRREQRRQTEKRFTEHHTLDQRLAGCWQVYERAMNEHPPDVAYADEMLAAMREAERNQP